MNSRSFRRTKAVTLTELLVVLAIISLLATIAVPVYINQMHRARVVTAQAEVSTIAEAQQMVAITHGFYVPIHILNNVPNAPGGASSTNRDDFENLGSTVFAIDATISVDRIFSPDGQPTVGSLQYNPRIQNTSGSDPRIRRMIEGWQGPFLNPRRLRLVGEDATNPRAGNFRQDLVVDPWGNPYRMYSSRGLIGDVGLPAGPLSSSDLAIGIDNGALNNGSNEPDRFDRFAIVSFGPDAVSGYTNSVVDQGDDIYYKFSGIAGNESTYQPF